MHMYAIWSKQDRMPMFIRGKTLKEAKEKVLAKRAEYQRDSHTKVYFKLLKVS